MVHSRRDLGCIWPKLQRSFTPTHTPMAPAHDAVCPRDTLVRPRHGLGHIQPKLRRRFTPTHTSYGVPTRAQFQGVLGPQLHGAPVRPRWRVRGMDKKGKKTLRYSVSKVYASQAATMNLAATKPPTVSTPNGPKATKKEPVVIDLTADSRSEGTARRRCSERKVNKAFRYRCELGNPLVLNHSPLSTTSESSTDEELLKASTEVGASNINFVNSCSDNSQGSR
ncbi:hypothetical protein PIB30_083549 [Stylosanthes scabra]|uniref:Uncharacterized protein n=1 Tax=Stylosanthes scabra TaxID=79078 RepID=A0ABU6WVS3_9FABA|nr:hypothetical protein [Stylosanthes scabra]